MNHTTKCIRIGLLNVGALSMLLTGFASAVGAQDAPPKARSRVQVTQKTDTILNTVIFKTPQGSIRVFLPADMRPEDAIVGTASLEPKGKNENDRASNHTLLSNYILSIATQSQTVKESVHHWNLPTDNKGDGFALVLTDASQQELARIVLSLPVLSEMGGKLPSNASPNTDRISLPVKGQAGRPLVLNLPFPSRTDDLHILVGDKEARFLVASPRIYVVESPRDILGKTNLQVKRGNLIIAEGEFRNNRISNNNTWGYVIGAVVILGLVLAVSVSKAVNDVQNGVGSAHF